MSERSLLITGDFGKRRCKRCKHLNDLAAPWFFSCYLFRADLQVDDDGDPCRLEACHEAERAAQHVAKQHAGFSELQARANDLVDRALTLHIEHIASTETTQFYISGVATNTPARAELAALEVTPEAYNMWARWEGILAGLPTDVTLSMSGATIDLRDFALPLRIAMWHAGKTVRWAALRAAGASPAAATPSAGASG